MKIECTTKIEKESLENVLQTKVTEEQETEEQENGNSNSSSVTQTLDCFILQMQ